LNAFKIPQWIKKLLFTEYMVKPDMRHGDIPTSKEAYSNSLRIALPSVAEMVSLALMGMIDMIMVGNLGEEAVAAVGLTGQPRMLVLAVFFALNIAVTAIVARNKGSGDMEAARSCMRHAMVIVAVLGTIAAVLSFWLSHPLMVLAGAQADTIGWASSYFRIISIALPAQILTGTICAAQRACGNTKITLKVNVVARVLSVILNLLLIEGRLGFPRLEVDGAAWSAVISAFVAFFLALMSVLNRDSLLRISRHDNWRFQMPMLKSIGRLTSGGMFEQVALRFGFFAYARIIAGLGTADFAAHMIAMQLMMLSFTFADGISAATTSLVGQTLGQKRPDLSIMYGKIGMRMALVCAALLSATVILTRYPFALLFASDPDIVSTAATLILILAAVMPIQTSQLVMGGSLRGAGDTRYVALTMLITVGILRPGLGFLFTFPLGLGLAGAWIAMVFDQLVRLIMLFTRFVRGKWIEVKI